MRPLFVEELKQVKGGGGRPPWNPCGITTTACCEESPKCDSCCDVA